MGSKDKRLFAVHFDIEFSSSDRTQTDDAALSLKLEVVAGTYDLNSECSLLAGLDLVPGGEE